MIILMQIDGLLIEVSIGKISILVGDFIFMVYSWIDESLSILTTAGLVFGEHQTKKLVN